MVKHSLLSVAIGVLLWSGHAIAAPFAYVPNQNSGDVSVIDVANNTVVTTIPVGPGPQGVAFLPDATKVYVTVSGANSVDVIDTQLNTVIATIAVGSISDGIVATPDGTRLYVTKLDGTVSVIDTTTNSVIATIAVGNAPRGIAISPDGHRAYVANWSWYSYTGSVSVIDVDTNSVVATVTMPAPAEIAVDPSGRYVYVTEDSYRAVSVIDTTTYAVVNQFTAGLYAWGIVFAPDGSRAYVTTAYGDTGMGSGTLTVVDTSNLANPSVIAVVAADYRLIGIDITPDGAYVYAAGTTDNTMYVFDTASLSIAATIPVGDDPWGTGRFIVHPTPPNLPPVADASGPYAGPKNADIPINGSASDPDGDAVTVTWSATPSGCTFADPNALSTTVNCSAIGGYTLTLTADDGHGNTTQSTAPLNVVNQAPVANAGGPYAGPEGFAIPIHGSASDPDGDLVTTAWSITPAGCTIANPSALSTTVRCDDEGVYTLTLTADDGQGGVTSSSTNVTVSDVAPTVTITSPANETVINVRQTVTVTASFTDPGTADTHTCLITWGDDPGTQTSGTITEANGSGTCVGSHTFSKADTYPVRVEVVDDNHLGAGVATITLIVIDPNGSRLTGRGTILSPLGGFISDPTASGRASFDFSAQYQGSHRKLVGGLSFSFPAGHLRFASTRPDWLVISEVHPGQAELKGVGKLNGKAGYLFRLFAYDQDSGHHRRGQDDMFRLVITDASGGLVYDNTVPPAPVDDLDDASPQPITSGQITIQRRELGEPGQQFTCGEHEDCEHERCEHERCEHERGEHDSGHDH